jgi:SAM-dependent methyltransferase
MDLKESLILGDTADGHWYYKSKAVAMFRYLGSFRPNLILDVGAGSGFFTKYLLRNTSASTGLCVDVGYAQEVEERYFGKVLAFQRRCENVPADLVLFMDVLEHVENDVALLKDYVIKVPTGARFLITVPAFKWLWSGHDVFLEHYRRYHIGQLETVVRQSGLLIERSTYYFGLVLPIAILLRLGERFRPSNDDVAQSQMKKQGRLINLALSALCRAELPVLRTNRLCGLSIFCLARKP